jgi:hypothetical protein
MLSRSRTYFWRVVSRNAAGTRTGPVWSFTTSGGAASTSIVIDSHDVASAYPRGVRTVARVPSPDAVTLATPATGWATTAPPAQPTFNDWIGVMALATDDRERADKWRRR